MFGDITYLRTGEGWLYLATVIELATRMVVGWQLADHMRTALVTDALQMAIDGGHVTDDAIFHSNRGTRYTSAEFDALTRRNRIRRSLGRTGVCWDNAAAESFFAALKNEMYYRQTFPTEPERASLWPNRSRCSRTAAGCIPPSATTPRSRPSPTTAPRQRPRPDHPRTCPRSLTQPTGTPLAIQCWTGTTGYYALDGGLHQTSYSCDPHGAVTETNNLTDNTVTNLNPYRFAGGFRDRFTPEVKFGRRSYDPNSGRFPQRDSRESLAYSANANRYRYAAGNPVNYTDPTGLAPRDWWQKAIKAFKRGLAWVWRKGKYLVRRTAPGAVLLCAWGGGWAYL